MAAGGKYKNESALNPLFVRVNEVHEGFDVVAVGDSGLFLAHLEALGDFAALGAAVEDEIAERGLFRVGFFDVLGDPIGDLAVGDGVFDDFDELFGVTPAALSHAPSKPLVKFSW